MFKSNRQQHPCCRRLRYIRPCAGLRYREHPIRYPVDISTRIQPTLLVGMERVETPLCHKDDGTFLIAAAHGGQTDLCVARGWAGTIHPFLDVSVSRIVPDEVIDAPHFRAGSEHIIAHDMDALVYLYNRIGIEVVPISNLAKTVASLVNVIE